MSAIPFTVIIASCNRPDRLANALAAVGEAIAAAGGVHAVIVADNGTDRSAAEVVADFATQRGIKARHIKTAPFDKTKALNAAIAAAETEWLAFTDDDCLPEPEWLQAAGIYAAKGEARLFSGELHAGPADFPLPRWLAGDRHQVIDWSPAFVDYAPLESDGILDVGDRVPFGANIFVHRDVFEQFGMYDEALWARCGVAALGCEDAEFAMRVRAGGEQIGYCAGARVMHPVFPERTTLKYYLRHIYHAGVREPFFSEDHSQRPPYLYLIRQGMTALLCAMGLWLRRHPGPAVARLMDATRDYGEIRGWLRKRLCK